MSDYFGLSAGDGNYSTASSYLVASRFQNTVGNGTLTKLELYCNAVQNTSLHCKFGVYADAAGPAPGTLLLYAGAVNLVANPGWIVISGLSLSVTNGTWYWLTFNLENTSTIRVLSTATSAYDAWVYTTAWPATWAGTEGTISQCVIRAYVETAAGLSIPVAMHHRKMQGVS